MTTGRINQVAVRNEKKTRDCLESRGPYQVGAAAIANTVGRTSCTCRLQQSRLKERLYVEGHRSHRQPTNFLSVYVFSD